MVVEKKSPSPSLTYLVVLGERMRVVPVAFLVPNIFLQCFYALGFQIGFLLLFNYDPYIVPEK